MSCERLRQIDCKLRTMQRVLYKLLQELLRLVETVNSSERDSYPSSSKKINGELWIELVL